MSGASLASILLWRCDVALADVTELQPVLEEQSEPDRKRYRRQSEETEHSKVGGHRGDDRVGQHDPDASREQDDPRTARLRRTDLGVER